MTLKILEPTALHYILAQTSVRYKSTKLQESLHSVLLQAATGDPFKYKRREEKEENEGFIKGLLSQISSCP